MKGAQPRLPFTFFFGLLTVAVGAVGYGRADVVLESPPSVDFPVTGGPMATLTASWTVLVPPEPGDRPIITRSVNIVFNRNIQDALLPSAKVVFGPFHLSFSGFSNAQDLSAFFRIRILAKSPALLKTVPGLVEIASETRSFVIPKDERGSGFVEDVFVEATMPGILTNVAIQAHVQLDSLTFSDSSKTTAFPAGHCEVVGSDDGCLHVAVSPTGLLQPALLPIAIIYEPPGGCSWASLTTARVAGTTIAVEETDADAQQTIYDHTLLGGAFGQPDEHSNYSTQKTEAKERQDYISIKSSETNGTVLAAGIHGEPECRTVAIDDPKRGPGKGDLFMFLAGPPFIYWNTVGLTNFKLPHGTVPGFEGLPANAVAYVWQLRDNQDLPAPLTCVERRAILALDPFFRGPLAGCDIEPVAPSPTPGKFGPFPKTTLSPARFAPIGPRICRPPDTFVMQSRQTGEGALFARDITDALTTISTTTKEDLGLKLLAKAFAFDISSSVGGSGFSALEGAFEQLFNEKETTTSTTTYSRKTSLDTVTAREITHNFFLRDANRSINVQPHYDSFFGTFAFLELPACLGTSPLTTDLPPFLLPTNVPRNANNDQALPVELSDSLRALGVPVQSGTHSFDPAPPDTYSVPAGLIKGLPRGLQLDAGSGRLIGVVTDGAGDTYQALFFGLDAQGQSVAELWVTVEVAGARVEAVCIGCATDTVPLHVTVSAELSGKSFSQITPFRFDTSSGESIALSAPDAARYGGRILEFYQWRSNKAATTDGTHLVVSADGAQTFTAAYMPMPSSSIPVLPSPTGRAGLLLISTLAVAMAWALRRLHVRISGTETTIAAIGTRFGLSKPCPAAVTEVAEAEILDLHDVAHGSRIVDLGDGDVRRA